MLIARSRQGASDRLDLIAGTSRIAYSVRADLPAPPLVRFPPFARGLLDERLGDYASICGHPVLLGSERFHWL
jgi:hypothetical protein